MQLLLGERQNIGVRRMMGRVHLVHNGSRIVMVHYWRIVNQSGRMTDIVVMDDGCVVSYVMMVNNGGMMIDAMVQSNCSIMTQIVSVVNKCTTMMQLRVV